MTDFLDTPSGRRIAYHQSAGTGVGIVFLGGFMSDMEGTKAVALEAWAQAQGRPFVRFDYSGHGQSAGAFIDGSIGEWAADAQAVITSLTQGPQIFVGSSMGGWIALLMTQRIADKVAGFVGIAAAPDFTEDSMLAGFSPEQIVELEENGVVLLPSGYGAPYPITSKLLDDGRDNLVLRTPLPLPFPVRFLQGTLDSSVERSVALRLLDHADGDDIQLKFIKGADHSFSSPVCLEAVQAAILDVTARV
ncbi:alpha/beta fold hydrolase [Pacificibacter marinus]|uniref:Alpha/beta hydrolase family protein n=1 Tax=Pacificibacter marinus TaxID=658057 RepID=A0A1Y5SSY4_9RHOB|nr:alpha/beta hydrolase [Pacificibacter marinus]SEK67514.1 Pimeloyl-ACP methyl ester carboxylesterase [Pacificibacter marinus]SLN46256.1 Alpha/beta hydrolase family protein [Pacificibacter marinus]